MLVLFDHTITVRDVMLISCMRIGITYYVYIMHTFLYHVISLYEDIVITCGFEYFSILLFLLPYYIIQISYVIWLSCICSCIYILYYMILLLYHILFGYHVFVLFDHTITISYVMSFGVEICNDPLGYFEN